MGPCLKDFGAGLLSPAPVFCLVQLLHDELYDLGEQVIQKRLSSEHLEL